MSPHLYRILLWVAVGIYVLIRLYVRLRRTIGQQEFRWTRLIMYLVVYGCLSAALAVIALGHVQLEAGWIGGMVPGIFLGFWGLHLTKFEETPKGRCYTPSAHIGVGLFLLFLGRIVYQGIAIYSNLSLTGRPQPAWGHSALTDLTFNLLAGYYITHSIGLIRAYRRPIPSAVAAG
jgi:hypothetical protein